ncbi:MAG: HipA domain-containing protein [Clostridiales bacterium]|jgi:hypothetical protein|nr:HipA domain-containing protein [Clostridiales bacterium]MDR2713708.1 HipA domain-containing protein [Clostridiales bacterium]
MDLDFKKSKINPLRIYGGANGNKIGIIHNGEDYMLKLPPKPTHNPEISYTNGCVSEYIACHIFQSLGIDTQETLLGHYGEKIAVACKDFEMDGFTLKDFAYLKNTIIDSKQNGYGTDLEDILKTIQEQQIIPSAELEKFFWEVFICDALLGNFDRHNGNWGFLINRNIGKVKIAPVFDCGSCLYPQNDDNGMAYILSDTKEIEKRIFALPTSAIQQEGKRISYFQFLMTTENNECLTALKVIGDRIDLPKIDAIIDDTPYISDIHKKFLKTMIKERKERIIDKALERIDIDYNSG